MNPHDLKDFETGSGLSHRFGLLTNRKLLCLKCANGASSVTFDQNVTAALMRGMVCRDVSISAILEIKFKTINY